MTYSLFDWMKENSDEYLNRIPEMLEAKVRHFSLSSLLSILYYIIGSPPIKGEGGEFLKFPQKRAGGGGGGSDFSHKKEGISKIGDCFKEDGVFYHLFLY